MQNLVWKIGDVMVTRIVLMKRFIRTPERGAETSIDLCCSDAVAGTTGQ